jgi:hypothetical protein
LRTIDNYQGEEAKVCSFLTSSVVSYQDASRS